MSEPLSEPISERRIDRLRDFVIGLGALVDQGGDEAALLTAGATQLAALVSHDDWLPEAFAHPDLVHYQQHLLYCDPTERFSVVSFVWGPGQTTPVHDHTVWGLIGMLRGGEVSQAYARQGAALVPAGAPHRLAPGDVEILSPAAGDIHQVVNAYEDRVSISIHVYGGNIGGVARSTFGPDGRPKPFVSGYSNCVIPNLWDRSANVRRELETARKIAS
jgi:predicted metal-dependent enzyme (double-stranded beta helix superfamily)